MKLYIISLVVLILFYFYCSTASELDEEDVGEDGNVTNLICNESNAE